MNFQLLFLSELKKLKTNNKGSFTLEASLVFPTILLITITVIMFSLYMYQKVILYNKASMVAERAAFIWDNSHKSPIDGSFSINAKDDWNDGLYWRLSGDNIFSMVEDTSDIDIRIDNGAVVNAADSLPKQKLTKSFIGSMSDNSNPVGAENYKGIKGTISYKNFFIDHKITVELENPMKIPFIGYLLKAKATARVTDPIEFMRTVDLLRTYSGEAKARIAAFKNPNNKESKKTK